MNPLQAAIQNPYAALSVVLGDTLHPGGREATRDLLDRVQLVEGETVLDLGCGAGAAAQLARERSAAPIGLDSDPTAEGVSVCGTMTTIPLADATVDVALSECAICLADDLRTALDEAHRVLVPGGRLALSDVTLEREIDGLPASLAEALCLTGQRSPEHLRSAIEAAGFQIVDERDHHDDLVEMRETVEAKLDYRGLLAAMGPQGRSLLDGVEQVEAALEARELGYVSIAARRPPG